MIKGYKEKKTKKLLEKTKKEFIDGLDKANKDEQKNLQKFIDSKITMEEYARTKESIETYKNIYRTNYKRLMDIEQRVKPEKKESFKIPTGTPQVPTKKATEDSGLGMKSKTNRSRATKDSGIGASKTGNKAGYLIKGTQNVLKDIESLEKKRHVNDLGLGFM